ncbi:MAG TPA: methionyl-tRNA formyltransferase, partial [Kiloniellales bacterium]|nr:methionyl-tRNA formyltransferase [Kiloniellales bacterium]
VRAFTPWPGAWFELEGERFKVLGAEVAEGEGAPGQVLDDELTIACGEGALRLTRLQRAGKAPMEAEALLRGFAIPPGIRLS